MRTRNEHLRKDISHLRQKDPMYQQIEKLFLDGWLHPSKSQPQIHAIFEIIPFDESSMKPFLDYRASVKISEKCHGDAGFCKRHERLLFHGTHRACALGEDLHQVRVCALEDCSLCGIIRGSYDIKRAGKRHKFKRFGAGIYTSSCSSKADDYSSNSLASSKRRVLLVNRVVLGLQCSKVRNDARLTRAPRGFDSVVGTPGIDLNFDEQVVYNNDAIRAAYLVVYGPVPPRRSFRETVKTLFRTPIVS